MDLIFSLIDKKVVGVLKIFAKNNEKTFYLREISRMSGVSTASTHRILKKIVKAGIIEEIKISKFTFYKMKKQTNSAKKNTLRLVLEALK